MKNNSKQKNMRMLENVELLLVNLFKKFILILIEPARRDKNTTRSKFSSYKCTANNKTNLLIVVRNNIECT